MQRCKEDISNEDFSAVRSNISDSSESQKIPNHITCTSGTGFCDPSKQFLRDLQTRSSIRYSCRLHPAAVIVHEVLWLYYKEIFVPAEDILLGVALISPLHTLTEPEKYKPDSCKLIWMLSISRSRYLKTLNTAKQS